ncbi:MAG: glycoside hydrolase family 31 protein, partial [Coriobacteriaceae bacterium]|nr:glycoside hydrolase family 31 protein [Coriobacteriaceae bacterium]
MHKQPLLKRTWVKGSAFVAAAALSLTLAAPAAQAVQLSGVQSAQVASDGYTVDVTFANNLKGKITFLDDGIFRYNVDPSGEFSAYAKPKDKKHAAKIQAQPDTSKKYSHPKATVKNNDADGTIEIKGGTTTIIFDKSTGKMTVKSGDRVVMEEAEALTVDGKGTVQTLVKHEGEDFFGGGTQNGRFIHTGNSINIANESNWVDGGVASPNPFYWSDAGYGVLRNTFANGSYDFGKTNGDTTVATHNENELDAYYFVTDAAKGKSTAPVAQKLLQEYFKVTGNPILMPEYAFYVGHLNAWNRDMWSAEAQQGYGKKQIKGSNPATEENAGEIQYEKGGTGTAMQPNTHVESLNGHGPKVHNENIPEGTDFPREFSAQHRLDSYVENDMPMGYFLPNDGYGAGYGQNGFGKTGGVNEDGSSSPERLAAVAANVENLKEFHDYAATKGVATGLWTQSYLTPDSNPSTQWQLLRDFKNEVKKGGVTTLKTDVAWVGPGYSMALDGTKTAYDIVTTEANFRPNIITLDGWAGTQRFGAIWTGDQTGGNWEYIRFHVPTFIGQSLAGNPNIGSDNDGIFGGAPIIATRDYQWKSFAPLMLDMDGWGSYVKAPQTHGDPYTGISRMYLKLKSQLMPYIYTTAASAANIDTGNKDEGLPIVRAILLSDDSAYAQSTKTQYEYTLGEDFLVAPIYQNTADADGDGNDVRNGIYLPGTEKDIWIDYFTGKQYKGGQVLNNFDAPLWKLPLFVKANAIIPMWEPNNSPDKVDRTVRNVEFFATEGKNSYTLFEDTGTYIENNLDKSNEEYGAEGNINYGNHVSSKFTSNVKDGTATFVAEKSTGDYKGYKKDRSTTFVVNVSAEPTSIVAKNGDTKLTVDKVTTQDAFDKATPEAGHAVVFYNTKPNLNYGAHTDNEKVKAEGFSKQEIITTPKLYVKFAKTDVKANAQTLELKGFKNEGNLPSDKVVDSIAVPTLTAPEDGLTPTSIKLAWNKIEGATGYDIKIDGMLNSLPSGEIVEFGVDDLEYHSTHKFQIRTRTAEGVSNWSQEMTATTLEDPWLEVPTPKSINWAGDVWGDHGPQKAFDHILQQGDGGFHSNGASLNKALTVDYGKVYDFTNLEYHPRDDHGNGTVTKMRIETSLDGAHWTKAQEYTWAPDATTKVVELNRKARFIRMTPIASVGNFFSASEIAVYKVAKSEGALPGSIKGDPQVAADDYSHLTGNCKGRENHGNGVSDWNSHIAASGADFNMNNAYDVYDMSWTMSALDGGTKKDGKVAGSIAVVPEKTSVKKGETLNVAVKVQGAKNVNAMGALVHYPSADFEFVGGSLKVAGKVGEMENLSGNYTFGDDKDSVNIALANKGDKALYNGTEDVVTFELRAKKDCDVNFENQTWLVGPKQDFIESDGSELGPQVKELGQDAFNITMTNDQLTTDDGNNVKKLVQTNSYNGLFNNDENNNDFEFKWDIAQNQTEGKLPAYVKLPTTMHFQLKQPRELKDVEILNRKGSNGTVTSMRAVITYEDGSKTEFNGGEFGKRQDVYTLKAAAGKKVKSVDITPLTSDGVATGYQGDAAKNRMLTLREINFNYVEGDQTPEKPQFQELGKDAFNISLTNKGYPTDDGTNVKKLVQQNNYDGLFNGQNDRAFEFKWFLGADTFDKKVGLPANLTFELKQPRPLANVELLNGDKASNGSINSLEAIITFADGTKQEFKGGEFSTNKPVYTFTVSEANKAKNVTKVEIKPLTSTGVATGIENPENRMLTIGEINFNYAEGTTPAPQQVNKDALKAKVDEVSGTKAEGYTAESFKTFDKALKAAQSVLKDQNATQKQVDDALKTLTDAFNGLEKKPVLSFSDVTDKTEHRDDILWLAETGVTTGFPDGTFRPYASV